MAHLTFCGAAGTVTGSCSMVTTDTTRFLIDCGLYQGNRSVRDLNIEPFPFDAKRVAFLILTHAHIDHSGLVPKLVKAGFDGPIHTNSIFCIWNMSRHNDSDLRGVEERR